MNREEICNLSDKEIDRLIAEKRMGWLSFDVKGVKTWFIEETRDYRLKSEWSPSTNISDAMEALEKFKNKVVVTIKLIGDRYDITLIGYKEAAVLREKSLPKAICQCICLYLNEKGKLE